MAAGRYVLLSSALLGLMIFLFVCLIAVPAIAGKPHNRSLWAVGLRDLAFSSGAFCLPASKKTRGENETRSG
jgi:hypothetical protein